MMSRRSARWPMPRCGRAAGRAAVGLTLHFHESRTGRARPLDGGAVRAEPGKKARAQEAAHAQVKAAMT